MMRFSRNALMFALVGVILAGMGVGLAQTAQVPAQLISYPELILHNGQIITCDDGESIVQAVAIRNGRFLAVGDNQTVLRLAGPDTQKIDLAGKSVVPGFIDTHLHQAFVGNLSKAGDSGRLTLVDKESGLEEMRQLVEASPPGKWISLGAPRNPAFFSLTKDDLDSVAPNNPLLLITVGADAVANSAAMKMAEIPLDTPGLGKEPETGEPNGQLVGWAAGIMLYEAKPWPPLRDLIPSQNAMFAKMNSEGLTTIIGRAQGLSMSVFRELWSQGELTARVRVAHEFLRMNPNGEAFLRRVGNMTGFGDDWFKIIGTTVMPVDGSDGEGAALSATPKLRTIERDAFGLFGQNKWIGFGGRHDSPNDWDNVGDEVKENSEWKNIVLANRYGWNVTSVHSAGDESTRITLKAYEEANREKPLEGRWGIDHQPMQTEETRALIKELDVIPSFYYFVAGGRRVGNMLYLYGPDRVANMLPLRTFIDDGIRPVAEADTSQYPFFAPLYNLENFVTRMDPQSDTPERPLGTSEKITRMEALFMYTKWAARYSQDEHQLGSIEPDKLGDLVVLDGDYFGVSENQMFEQLSVVMTVVGGKIVYQTNEKKAPSNEPEQRRRF